MSEYSVKNISKLLMLLPEKMVVWPAIHAEGPG